MTKFPRKPIAPLPVPVPKKEYYTETSPLFFTTISNTYDSLTLNLPDLIANGISIIHVEVDDGYIRFASEEGQTRTDDQAFAAAQRRYNEYLTKVQKYEKDLAKWNAHPDVAAKHQKDKEEKIKKLEKELLKLKATP